MEDRALAVVCKGDPRSPHTWSGTPRNLILAFESMGYTIAGLDLKPMQPVNDGLKAASMLAGNGREWARTPISFVVNRYMLRSLLPVTIVNSLHMGTLTIPSGTDQSKAHSIYMDSTFHLWQTMGYGAPTGSVARTYDRFENKALMAAHHIFTTAEYVLRDVVDYYGVPPERVTVVGTGRGSIRPSAQLKDYSSRTVLFVGKNRFEDKGGMLLLNGFDRAVRRDPRLHLVVVAEEKYRPAVEAVQNATFKTNIPWEELEGLFNSASLFAMPADYEPWGLVYIEALVCRTPVLGLNRNALPELTEHGKSGFLLNEGTPEALADCLLDALSDPERLAKMGRIGQEFALRQFTWKRVASKIGCRLFEGSELPV